jgi:hypothetical protein
MKEIEDIDKKIDEIYSDANGYTEADRKDLKDRGADYRTALANAFAEFDSGVDAYRDLEKALD